MSLIGFYFILNFCDTSWVSLELHLFILSAVEFWGLLVNVRHLSGWEGIEHAKRISV